MDDMGGLLDELRIMLVTAEAGTLLSLVMDMAPLELNTFLRLIFRFQEKYCL